MPSNAASNAPKTAQAIDPTMPAELTPDSAPVKRPITAQSAAHATRGPKGNGSLRTSIFGETRLYDALRTFSRTSQNGAIDYGVGHQDNQHSTLVHTAKKPRLNRASALAG